MRALSTTEVNDVSGGLNLLAGVSLLLSPLLKISIGASVNTGSCAPVCAPKPAPSCGRRC
ncbi:MAG TPA: hypothetical protein VF503_18780 [Sphingobium sp.]|uniref:hypothetical protein n=1 Tax=Sphingobium sp. TaxID=1912891 RepID=UPI002ED2DA6A